MMLYDTIFIHLVVCLTTDINDMIYDMI